MQHHTAFLHKVLSTLGRQVGVLKIMVKCHLCHCKVMFT